MTNIFDFVKQTANLELVHPVTGEPLGVTLKIQPKEAPVIKKKMLEAHQYLRSGAGAEDPKKATEFILRAEALATEIAAEAIIGWDNDEVMGGEYSPAFVKQLLADPRAQFIRLQVNQALAKEELFFQ